MSSVISSVVPPPSTRRPLHGNVSVSAPSASTLQEEDDDDAYVDLKPNGTGLMTHLRREWDDARRLILQSAPSSVRDSPWLSPDATTWTVRHAPSRTSSTMSRLASRCGTLLVQQSAPGTGAGSNGIGGGSGGGGIGGVGGVGGGSGKWKNHYCCIVQHTFLYLYDLEKSQSPLQGGGGGLPSMPMSELNELLTCGATTRYRNAVADDDDDRSIDPRTVPLKPTGVVDLQGYTEARPMQGGHILELRPADVEDDFEEDNASKLGFVRPSNLPSIYFRGPSPDECREWQTSLLGDRYSSVRTRLDDADRQNHRMRSQLDQVVSMMEEEERKRKSAESEAYQVRTAAQQLRSTIAGTVRRSLELTAGLDDDEDGVGAAIGAKDGDGKHGSATTSNLAELWKVFRAGNEQRGNNNGGEDDDVHYRRLEERRREALERLRGGGGGRAASEAGASSVPGSVVTHAALQPLQPADALESVEILADFVAGLLEDRLEMDRALFLVRQELAESRRRTVTREVHETLQKQHRLALAEKTATQEKLHTMTEKFRTAKAAAAETRWLLEQKQEELLQLPEHYRAKIRELEDHKAALKKEVLELRRKKHHVTQRYTNRFTQSAETNNNGGPTPTVRLGVGQVNTNTNMSNGNGDDDDNGIHHTNSALDDRHFGLSSDVRCPPSPTFDASLGPLPTLPSEDDDDDYDQDGSHQITSLGSLDSHETDEFFKQLQQIKVDDDGGAGSTANRWMAAANCTGIGVNLGNAPHTTKKGRSKAKSAAGVSTISNATLSSVLSSKFMCGQHDQTL